MSALVTDLSNHYTVSARLQEANARFLVMFVFLAIDLNYERDNRLLKNASTNNR